MSERLSYGSYLRVNDLISLQAPLSRPEHHDELLFIIIHQVYELWFKQLLHELDAVVGDLRSDQLMRARKHFRRIHTIQRLLEQQVDVLETMAPNDFNKFRENLNPASGFQSIQFREMEFLCGVRRTETLVHIEMDTAQRARLERRLAEPSINDDLKSALARQGFATDSHEAMLASLERIYTNENDHYELYMLLEDLIELDERLLLWRGRHVRMVERMIGHKQGTGGSSGVDYLQKTLSYRCFPELWEVRTRLGAPSYG